jgi:hypothetical protein
LPDERVFCHHLRAYSRLAAVPGEPFPPTPADWGIAFFYGTLSCAWVHWKVPPNLVAPLVPAGFKPALFDGQAVVNVDFQAYTATFNNGLEMTNEMELNLVVYPEAREAYVPALPLYDYLVGMEQQKIIGNYRLAVSCDDLVAIYYGRLVFGENKYTGTFNYTIPNVNGQSSNVLYGPPLWDIVAFDSPTPIPTTPPTNPPPVAQGVKICQLTIDTSKVSGSRVAAPSPFVRYSRWPAIPPAGPEPVVIPSRPAGSHWNVLGPHQLSMIEPPAPNPVTLTLGPSTGPMAAALNQLNLANLPPVAITTYQSQPSAIEGRPFFADLP